jgi:hypothetical protein
MFSACGGFAFRVCPTRVQRTATAKLIITLAEPGRRLEIVAARFILAFR